MVAMLAPPLLSAKHTGSGEWMRGWRQGLLHSKRDTTHRSPNHITIAPERADSAQITASIDAEWKLGPRSGLRLSSPSAQFKQLNHVDHPDAWTPSMRAEGSC